MIGIVGVHLVVMIGYVWLGSLWHWLKGLLWGLRLGLYFGFLGFGMWHRDNRGWYDLGYEEFG